MLLKNISQYESPGVKLGMKACTFGFRLLSFLVILLYLVTKSLKIRKMSARLFPIVPGHPSKQSIELVLYSINNNGCHNSLGASSSSCCVFSRTFRRESFFHWESCWATQSWRPPKSPHDIAVIRHLISAICKFLYKRLMAKTTWLTIRCSSASSSLPSIKQLSQYLFPQYAPICAPHRATCGSAAPT